MRRFVNCCMTRTSVAALAGSRIAVWRVVPLRRDLERSAPSRNNQLSAYVGSVLGPYHHQLRGSSQSNLSSFTNIEKMSSDDSGPKMNYCNGGAIGGKCNKGCTITQEELEKNNVALADKCPGCGHLFGLHPSVQQQQQSIAGRKPFDVDHLRSVTYDDTWHETSALTFRGRCAFAAQVAEHASKLLQEAPLNNQNTVALVYSSVSGTGKTVSLMMLRETLKDKLPKDTNFIVGYLGFSSSVVLNDEEEASINAHGADGAERVLARRLCGSVIVAHYNAGQAPATALPTYEVLYKGRAIPTVDESFAMLKEALGYSADKRVVVVAGVDEVQLLNQNKATRVNDVGLGRFFLRVLRQWQYSQYRGGLTVVPLGTGISLDFPSDPTTGTNVPLNGNDAVLISKDDFRQVVYDVMTDDAMKKRGITGPKSMCTYRELAAAMLWPRLRRLEWWKQGRKSATSFTNDSNCDKWYLWLQYWMRDERIAVSPKYLLPGIDDSEGVIHALFEMNGNCVLVVPDGYSWPSIVQSLSTNLAVDFLYNSLFITGQQDIEEVLKTNGLQYEDFGFSALGAALHVGAQAMYGRGSLTLATATAVQKKRLGVVLWLQSIGALPLKGVKPTVFGGVFRVDATDYYPYAGRRKTNARFGSLFLDNFTAELKEERPIFIRCGRLSPCDYIFLYPRMVYTRTSVVIKWVAIFGDAKHTIVDTKITTTDQINLWRAVLSFSKACEAIPGLELDSENIKLLFVTNRQGMQGANRGVKKTKQEVLHKFPGAMLEMLTPETFEFPPFSDTLFARMQTSRRRK